MYGYQGQWTCIEKLCQYFSNMTGKTHFYSKDKSPHDSFQCTEKGSVLGNSRESGCSCCAWELAGYEMETAAAPRHTGQKCLLCPAARNLLCWSWALKYPEEPLPQWSLAQSIGTLGLHCLCGYDRPWSIYW